MKKDHTETLKKLEAAGIPLEDVIKMVYARAGQSKSPAKQAASRRNAIKGGMTKAKPAPVPTIRQTDIWKTEKKAPEPIFFMQDEKDMRVLVLK